MQINLIRVIDQHALGNFARTSRDGATPLSANDERTISMMVRSRTWSGERFTAT
jgi:hypothetical protein